MADALVGGGDALRFDIETPNGLVPAFVFRWHGAVHAYVNRCEHMPVELDWNPGKFFDASGDWLICATHGALYEPASGVCVAGPCAGRRLQRLHVSEQNEVVHLLQEE